VIIMGLWRPGSSSTSLAGLLIFIGCAQFLIMLVVSSSLYPGYSISHNYISDLGATCRGSSCIVFQPSSVIFNTSVSLLGYLLVVASILLARSGSKGIFASLLLISGLGAIGVGIFPESYGMLHSISALITFLFGGLAAITSHRILEGPARLIGPSMGVLALLFLALFILGIHMGLGPGGVERILAYLELLFGVMLGGYLMSRSYTKS
jgi:hypothetical membrane protein